jgi:isopenicillin N synthase-like dioxygenase
MGVSVHTVAPLPILDLSRFQSPGDDRAAFLTELGEVARSTGFFYLTGHGVSPALGERAFALSRRFFALPAADKRAIAMVNSPHFRGYTDAGGEYTRGKPDWREELDIGLEVEAHPAQPGDPAWRRLRGPNQWPAVLPEFRPVLLHWQDEMIRVAATLLKAFALALHQPEDVFDSALTETPNVLLKTIRYPGRHETLDDQGCGPHKDGGLLTLVRQDRVGGLQVETDAGWVDAPPVPGTFVVNIGEALELASDGYLRATVHRVVTPPAGDDRLSLAFFLGAGLESTVPRLTLPPELAALALGPERDPDNPLFYDVGRNVLKGRLRSHPDVARRFYADVLDE